jgi:hypothetical protein
MSRHFFLFITIFNIFEVKVVLSVLIGFALFCKYYNFVYNIVKELIFKIQSD